MAAMKSIVADPGASVPVSPSASLLRQTSAARRVRAATACPWLARNLLAAAERDDAQARALESRAMFLKHACNFRTARDQLMQDARAADSAGNRASFAHWARRCNRSVVHFSRQARLAGAL